MIQILIAPLATAIIAQLIKFFIKGNGLKLNWQSFSSYAGMPSSHAAMAASLMTSVGLTEGFDSPLFFVCIIFSFFIIRDALGLRNYIGQNGQTLNSLIKNLSDNKIINLEKQPRLIEKVGHTPMQIIAGLILGVLVSYLFFIAL
ncbi:MAG: divergent PAP2 family protein [Patescibacteria group bacterium]|jgi:hypothetical protein